MSKTLDYSAAIERMRMARNVPTPENRTAGSPGPEHEAAPEPVIHPRLLGLKQQIAKLLRLDDPTEVLAALEDLQLLVDRCGYHFRGAFIAQMRKQERAKHRVSAGLTPARRRGRPKGSANIAARQFGLGLAQIWQEHGGQRPTRRVHWGSGRHYGPYRDFVELIVTGLADAPWLRRNGELHEVDYLLRDSVAEFKAAQQAPEEYRRRGLIDEHRWLRVDE